MVDARLNELLDRLPAESAVEAALSMTPAAMKVRTYRAGLGVDRAREEYKRQVHNRRARILGGGGTYDIDDWLKLCVAAENRCLRCRKGGQLEIDHVVPLEDGGSNTIDNIQPLCPACNRWKGRESFDFRPLIQFIGLLVWRAL